MSIFKDMFNDLTYLLSEKEYMIFNFISSNFITVSTMDIRELSLKLNTSEYTIKKFCKKLNVDTYSNLLSILKEISKTSLNNSINLYNITLERFSNFILKLDESTLKNCCELIIKNPNFSIYHSKSTKLIGEYFKDRLNSIKINCNLTYSTKQILKQKDNNLILFITSSIEDSSSIKILNTFSNKIVITISDSLIKNLHNNSTVFIHIENVLTLRDFKTYSQAMYFTVCDLIISKLLEIILSKN